MPSLRLIVAITMAVWLAACSTTAPLPVDRVALQRQVTQAETAFAKTMADRNHAGFASFLAEDTIFFSGPTPLHGKATVAEWWKRFFTAPEAPFSWKPERVEVLDNGTLAMTTGPVFDPSGKAVASFTSVWRQESPGVWKIVFDKGCNCP